MYIKIRLFLEQILDNYAEGTIIFRIKEKFENYE